MRTRFTGFTTIMASVAAVVALSLTSPGLAAVTTPAANPPPDIPGVPHYFGPYPNWANSPFTESTAQVAIQGAGTGATAMANVDPVSGGITSIDVTSPGRDYLPGTTVAITGGNDPQATATVNVNTSGGVVSFNGITPGSNYQAFDVAITGGSGTGATAVASGAVDVVNVTDPGSGYTFPTVDFDMPDAPDGVQAHGTAEMNGAGEITGVTITEPGSGYYTNPGVSIINGTQFDPVALENGGTLATANTRLRLNAVDPVDVGTGYTGTPPTVTITDPVGSGTNAAATAVTDSGAITGITVNGPLPAGSGYLSQGMKKFEDDLPLPCHPDVQPPAAGACPEGDPAAKYLPLAVPEAKTYDGVEADEYVIGLVQYRTQYSSSIPEGTLSRGYVQLETPANAGISEHYVLENELLDGTKVPVDGNYLGVTAPQPLGPIIAATKDKPVRVVFRNLLPNGSDGDLFMPNDGTIMGAGMGPDPMPEPNDAQSVLDEVRNPLCTYNPQSPMCFKQNRATLHLHGGVSPWISDGTPHQWITPANEDTNWPQGVSVRNVPDMEPVCAAADDGCMTFYYTNQQSARMMFYHDHSWGITRLNVYAGEAAGYLIGDSTEQALVNSGTIPGADDTVPLIVQDKTFLPGEAQRMLQDPTWDVAKWGGKGAFWVQHVYMPAQNPGDPSGMSGFGRWMYGPWFFPPAAGTKYGPIPNPYFNANCDLDVPSTWQYDTDPFCEPQQIPGTPNVSIGMEQFNDTPTVNGVAYPKITLDPKTYRLRVLNAANDRFFNLQWYIADPTQGTGLTEVALKPAELEAAQTDPTVFPTPVQGAATAGPDWVQIGSESGFLPAPTVVDGQQPTTWIEDPTRFDVGNVDLHSLLLGPAERADAIVDFSQFAGKTLILYNDAPAAFPARVPSYDYYTGAPDLSPVGAPKILPGYGPNTRTVMQVTIANNTPAAAFNVPRLRTAFAHKANGTGVFESGQHPIVVGQAAYNSAYGSSFAAASNCNAPGSTTTRCDGFVRINDTSTFSFNTLRQQNQKMTMRLEPKSIHDEMNSSTFDEFGRMQANLGVEVSPPTPATNNVVLYPYVNPQTELLDGTNLPKADVKVTPISDAADGTQLWRITHNGVDTHPIHFHLTDVQVLNRVTWDNIVIPPEPSELGWKETVRISPLEDTIVAMRPAVPVVPWEVPNAIRMLNPAMPAGSTAGFNNVDGNGNPTNSIVNQLVNFGWEYVFHCHILTHEEMDMMRPVSLAVPPDKADGVALSTTGTGTNARIKIDWNDNSITETSFLVQRSTLNGTTWTDVGTVQSPLGQPNTHEARTFTDNTSNVSSSYRYRVVARNTVGYGGQFQSLTVRSDSDPATWNPASAPTVPTNLAVSVAGPGAVNATWSPPASDGGSAITGYRVVARLTPTGGSVVGSCSTTGALSCTVSGLSPNTTYYFQANATNSVGSSPYTMPRIPLTTTALGAPTVPLNLAVSVNGAGTVGATWSPPANNGGSPITGYRVVARLTPTGGSVIRSCSTTGALACTITGLTPGTTYYFQANATNAVGTSPYTMPRIPLVAG